MQIQDKDLEIFPIELPEGDRTFGVCFMREFKTRHDAKTFIKSVILSTLRE